MDVITLPFNELIGMERSPEPDGLLRLLDRPSLHNHLGTFHAAALFSLAEASSAEFLLSHRAERTDVQGVVRKSSCKYSAPARGTITSHSPTPPAEIVAAIASVDTKGRALVTIEIALRDEAAQTVATFSFTWFLGKEAARNG